MKKTITLILAAASVVSAADPILDLGQGNVEQKEYSLSGISNHQYTAAITLNLEVMAQTPGISPIFALGGAAGGYYGAEVIAFDNGGIDYNSQRKGTLEEAFTFSVYNYSWQSVEGFTSLKELPNWSNAKSAAFVLVGDMYSSTKDEFTGYLFILNNDDSVSAYAGEKNWSFTTSVDTLKIYTNCVDSLQVYNETMDGKQAQALALSMMENSTPGTDNTVPEPTTATLSLLALAGLAARRRRR